MNETKSTQKVPQKVGIGEKFAYLCTNIGNIPLMMLLSMFLTIFYTDVCGMDPARVATMFLLSKVVDGISDPLMGFLMDRVPQTKFGRMRTMLILGTIICSINYMFVWFGPAWFPAAKYAIAYITYLLLGITFDIMDISLNSMLPLMTDDLKTRNQLSAIKMFGYMAGAMALSIVGPVIVADSTLNSYYILIFGSLAVVVVFSIGGALGIHERVKVEEGAEHRYNFIDLLKILITRPILVMLIVNLIMNTGNMLISGVQTYFYTYIIGNLALMSIVSVASTIASIPAMFISAVISDRIGKKKTFLIGLIVSAIGLAIRIPGVYQPCRSRRLDHRVQLRQRSGQYAGLRYQRGQLQLCGVFHRKARGGRCRLHILLHYQMCPGPRRRYPALHPGRNRICGKRGDTD